MGTVKAIIALRLYFLFRLKVMGIVAFVNVDIGERMRDKLLEDVEKNPKRFMKVRIDKGG